MPAKRYKVHLFPEERDELQCLVSKGKAAAYKRTRAQILLKADQGPQGPAWTDQHICEAFDVGRVTVERTRKALVLEGLDAALQRKQREHPPVARKLDGDGEAQLLALACSKAPAGYAKWTMQLYADKLVELQVVESISDETVRRTLKKNELKPWLTKRWCIPPKANADFVCAMEETLEGYRRPYSASRPLVCIDETSKQQVKETRAPLPSQPGRPQRYDYEYERNGVSNLFMIFAPLEGWRHVKVTDRRTNVDWAHCLKDLVDVHFPQAEQIVLMSDNLHTHKPAALYEACAPQEARRIIEKLEWHHTPKHGSWLDMAEIELSVLQRQC